MHKQAKIIQYDIELETYQILSEYQIYTFGLSELCSKYTFIQQNIEQKRIY